MTTNSIERRYRKLVERLPASKRPLVDYAAVYGTTTDVQPRLKSKPVISSPLPQRPFSPLVKDLQTRLAARAGKPRSRPTLHVDIGAPSRQGDEDAVPEYPSDGRRMS